MFSSIAFIVIWWAIDEYANGDRKLIVCLLATLGVCAAVWCGGRYGARYCYTSEQRHQAASKPLPVPVVPRTTRSTSYEDFMAAYIAKSEKNYLAYLDGERFAE